MPDVAVTLHLREAPAAVYGAIRGYFEDRRYTFQWGVEPQSLVFERGSLAGALLALSTRHVATRLEIILREEPEDELGPTLKVECHYVFPDWVLATPAALLLPLHLVRLHEEANRLEAFLLQRQWRRRSRPG